MGVLCDDRATLNPCWLPSAPSVEGRPRGLLRDDTEPSLLRLDLLAGGGAAMRLTLADVDAVGAGLCWDGADVGVPCPNAAQLPESDLPCDIAVAGTTAGALGFVCCTAPVPVDCL